MFSRLEFAQKTASIKCVQIKIDFYYSRHRDATNRNIIVHKMSFYSAVSTDKKVRFLAYIYTPPPPLSLSCFINGISINKFLDTCTVMYMHT